MIGPLVGNMPTALLPKGPKRPSNGIQKPTIWPSKRINKSFSTDGRRRFPEIKVKTQSSSDGCPHHHLQAATATICEANIYSIRTINSPFGKKLYLDSLMNEARKDEMIIAL
jgi:hypothetical protein